LTCDLLVARKRRRPKKLPLAACEEGEVWRRTCEVPLADLGGVLGLEEGAVEAETIRGTVIEEAFKLGLVVGWCEESRRGALAGEGRAMVEDFIEKEGDGLGAGEAADREDAKEEVVDERDRVEDDVEKLSLGSEYGIGGESKSSSSSCSSSASLPSRAPAPAVEGRLREE
jgi:hypothetical protein